MSHIQQPLTLPKHPELLQCINEMKIDILLTHLATPATKAKLQSDKRDIKEPTWQDTVALLTECYRVINEIREDPRKY